MTTYLRGITRIRSGGGDVSAVRDGLGALMWTPPAGYATVRTLHDVEADITGWGGATGTTGTADVLAHETAAPIQGSGSLRITRTWGAGSDYQRARAPFRDPADRDLRGSGVDAIGTLVLVPAAAPGTGWSARIRIQNGVGTVVVESLDVPLTKGVATRVWAPMQQEILADVGGITVQVSANGVNASQHVLYDSVVLGASGSVYEEDTPAPGGGTLWETTFATADPKAELAVEPGTEIDPGNLTFPTVGGAQRLRVSWPVVGNRRGYQGRSRFSALGTTGQSEVEFTYDLFIPAALKSELQAGRDVRVPGLAGLPDEQPGTYTSLDGVLRPDSFSALLHLKAQETITTGTTSGNSIAQTFTSPTGTFSSVNSSVGTHPDFWIEGGSPPLVVSGGLASQSVSAGKYGRIMSNKRFGGDGMTVRITSRCRASSIPGGVNAPGNAFCLKFPAAQSVTGYSQDDPRSVRGTGDSRSPGYYLFRHGVNSDRRTEIVRRAFGPNGVTNEYIVVGRGPTISKAYTVFRDVVIEFQWPKNGDGQWRYRLWVDRDRSLSPTWSAARTETDSRYNIPAFFWSRADAATFEWDTMYVEEIGASGSTTTTVVPAWAEATAYAPHAGGKTTEGDPYGLRFPLRRDLLLTSSTDRTAYWEPPSGVSVKVRQRVKVNTPGANDGEWDVWIDGTQYLRLRDVQWRAAGVSVPVNQVLHDTLITQGGGVSATGRTSEVTSMRLTDVTGLAPPSAPTNLAAGTVTSTSVPLTWTAGTGADSHELLRDGVVIATGLGTSYTDSGRTPSTTYVYGVRAVNAGGKSATVSLTVTTTAGTVTQAYLPPDDFATAFAAKWNSTAAGRIDAGRGAIDYATTYPRILTAPADARGKASTLEFLNTPPSGARHDLSLRIDASNNYEFIQFGTGTLRVQRTVGGVITELYRTTLDATAHRWLRIRETGGEVVFDVRSTAGPWVELFREQAQVDMSAVREAVTAYAPSGTTGTFLFDNSNLPPA